MSSNFDWSSFEEVPQENAQSFDWSQYSALDEQPKQGGIRGEIERKVAGPAVNLITKAATAIPETAKGVSTLVGKGVNALLKQFGKGMTDEEFAKADKIIRRLHPLGTTPDVGLVQNVIKEATGGRLEPTTPAERIISGTAGIIGSVAGFGPAAVLGSPIAALGTGAMALTTAGLEEAGVPPWLALGGGILMDIATRSGANLVKRLGSVSGKGIRESAGKMAAKAAKLKPADVKNELVAAGERLGIKQGEIPLSAQLDNRAIQGFETKLRESSLSGRSLEKQLQNVESKARGSYEEIANQISSRQNSLPGVVSEEAITQLKQAEQNSEQIYRSLYKQAEKVLPPEAVIKATTGKRLYEMLDSTIRRLSGGSGSPTKDPIVSRLTRLKNDWQKRFPTGEVPIQDLINQKIDFNSIIKYETKGGADKFMVPLNHFTKNAIQNYGRSSNLPFLSRFNQAETRFANSAKEFRKNDAVRALLDTQNPQQIIQKMKNVKTYRELKRLFDRTEEGKEAFNAMSRYLLEDIIGSKLLNKEGKISWGNASGMLKDPKKREIVSEIIGKENFDKLKDLSKFSFGIEEGLRKFANSSGTATKGLDVALVLGTLGKAMSQLFQGRIIGAGRTMTLLLAPAAVAKLMSNPEFIEAMVEVSQAAKGKNPQVFFDAAERAARFALPEIINSNSNQEPSL